MRYLMLRVVLCLCFGLLASCGAFGEPGRYDTVEMELNAIHQYAGSLVANTFVVHEVVGERQSVSQCDPLNRERGGVTLCVRVGELSGREIVEELRAAVESRGLPTVDEPTTDPVLATGGFTAEVDEIAGNLWISPFRSRSNDFEVARIAALTGCYPPDRVEDSSAISYVQGDVEFVTTRFSTPG